jgi:Lrp/AsnC family transcriptional regulator for asnA, asnC and gidA
LDELDLAIVRRLQKDGRKPYTEIAQELDVSEGTIRNRVSRLVEDQICVTLEPGDWDPTISVIANFEEVSYLVLVSGEFDLMVEVMCRDRDHLANFLNEKLRRVSGVVRTQTLTILRTYKMAYGARPTLIPSEQPSG